MTILTKNLKDNLKLSLFYIPSLVILIFFLVLPILEGLLYSFTDWNGVKPVIKFIGVDNYIKIFNDKSMMIDLKNTLIFCVIVTLVTNILSLLVALAVDEVKIGRGFFRTIFYMPSILMPLVVGFVWTYIYSPKDGVLNTILASLKLGQGKTVWLGDPKIVLYAVVAAVIWQALGYYMVIYLAGLQSIPADLIEASRIDGSNLLKTFFHIKLPLLTPTITICIVLATIGGLKTFDIIWAMTQGGPGHFSETLTVRTYIEAFKNGNFSYSVAISVVLTAIVLILTLFQLKFLKKREVDL